MTIGPAVLVTGGAGYIGAHTCKILAESGFLPIVIDNLSQGHADFVQWGPFYQGKISDQILLNKIFSEHQILAVLHFSGSTFVGESVNNPAKYYHNNFIEPLNLLDIVLEYKTKYFIFSSTCATYGEPKTTRLTENHSQKPINPYGQTKLFLEKTLLDYDKAYGLKSCFLRYFNAAGADIDLTIGEDHNPETHLIPLIFDAAMGKKSSITIFGTDYPTNDGTCIRDYIHVLDLAQAHVLALKYLMTGGETNSFNLGSENGFSVKEMIQTCEKVTERFIPVVEGPRRPGDPAILLADATKAKNILNWQTKYSDIETIIKTAWQWHQKRF